LNLPLLKGSAIVGVFWGEFRRRDPERARSELERLLDYARTQRIKPLITAKYPLAEGGRALADVYGRRTAGKVVIEP
jgi:NADPH2:quinone reductase